jgi:hypothetical protein
MQSRNPEFIFSVNYNFSADNLIYMDKSLQVITPPTPDMDFLLLDGTNFLLLDGTNFLIL